MLSAGFICIFHVFCNWKRFQCGYTKRAPDNARSFRYPRPSNRDHHRSPVRMVSHGGSSGAGESRCLFPELSLRGAKKASGPKAPKAFALEKSTPSAMEGQAAGRTWRQCRVSLQALRPTLSRGLLFSMRYAVLPGLVLRSGTGKRGRLLPERSPFQGV